MNVERTSNERRSTYIYFTGGGGGGGGGGGTSVVATSATLASGRGGGGSGDCGATSCQTLRPCATFFGLNAIRWGFVPPSYKMKNVSTSTAFHFKASPSCLGLRATIARLRANFLEPLEY